jgi:hypothetical protein
MAATPSAAAEPRPKSRAVILPGVLLFLVGLLDLLGGLALLGGGYLLLVADASQLRFLEYKHPEGTTVPKNAWSPADYQFYGTLVFFAAGVLSAVIAFPVMIGGSAMMRSRSWFASVLAALLALISPGGFVLLGLIAGIWALAVLFNPNVRQSFR